MPEANSVGLRRARVLPARPGQAAMIIAAFTGVLYLTEAVDTLLNGALNQDGIRPRQLNGLEGILWAPLLHTSWQHLAANTVPVLVFGFFAVAGGAGQFIAVTATVWLIGGLGTWLTGSTGTHVGASILVFGWFVFLLARGLLTRSPAQILLAVVLFALWGSVLWSLLPGAAGISWQGHLFGAAGGLVAAYLVAHADRTHADRSPRPRLTGS
ncbi:MAG TPA: rhomboid family intramembrane serine protease [Pseudonocardiaceae bacterium]|nr:rhomboid family intramembrane serine protease [Pseudonocardiaceae bacterium]